MEARQLTKRYGALVANDRVDFAVRGGEVHALLGENGAGKTTLAGMLFGAVRPDEGSILVRGEQVDLTGPRHAIELGIGMVYQHFMLVPELSVAENVAMGSRFPGPRRLVRKAVEDEVAAVAESYGLDIDPTAVTGALPIDLQQKVEILRCLYRDAQVLILDEPTAVLGPVEVERLFETLDSLRERGAGIVIITHKVSEVMSIGDRATILRGGVLRDSFGRADFDEGRLVAEMVEGFLPDDSLGVDRAAGGDVLLRVRGMSSAPARTGHGPSRRPAVEDVDIELRAGEILGIAGVEGNGQVEFVEMLAGERPVARGSIELGDQDVTGWSPGRRRRAGLLTVPEDRKAAGLIESMSVGDNLALPGIVDGHHSRWGFLRPGSILAHARRLISEFGVRPGHARLRVGALSGGNQQRVVLARVIDAGPVVLVAAHPTRGLDVGATHFIHQRLLALRADGVAVVLLSADLDELMRLSDRIGVFYRGRIDLTLERQDFDMTRIAGAMAGTL